jgi:hypothetical protein
MSVTLPSTIHTSSIFDELFLLMRNIQGRHIAWHHTFIFHQEANLKNKKKLKKSISIWSHILRILSTLTLHGPFVRYWNSEFAPSLENSWNSLWFFYSELPHTLLSLSSNSEVDKSLSSVQIEISNNTPWFSEIITPELFVVYRCVNTRWKGIEVIYNSCVVCFS